MAAGEPSLAARYHYGLVHAAGKAIVLAFFPAFPVILVASESHAWLVVLGMIALYLLLVRRVMASAMRREARVRSILQGLGMEYSIEGPRVDSFGIDAIPFGLKAVGHTDLYGRGTFEGSVVEGCFSLGLDKGQGYALLYSLDHAFPTVALVPNGVLTGELGAMTLVATESAAFDGRWRVVGRDPEFAHAFLSPQVMSRLLSDPHPPQKLTISGHYIYVHDDAEGVLRAGHLRLLADVARLIPGGVAAKFSTAMPHESHEPRTPVQEVIAAHAAPRNAEAFAPPRRISPVALLAFVLALLVPILGPVVALILLAGRDRRAPGESSVYAFAIYMGMTELLLTVLAFVFIPLLN